MFGVWKTCVERESTKHPEIGLQVRKETGRDGNWGAAFDSATHRNYGLEQVTDPDADVSSFIEWNFRLGSPWANSSFHTLHINQTAAVSLCTAPNSFLSSSPMTCVHKALLSRDLDRQPPCLPPFFFFFVSTYSSLMILSYACVVACMLSCDWLLATPCPLCMGFSR